MSSFSHCLLLSSQMPAPGRTVSKLLVEDMQTFRSQENRRAFCAKATCYVPQYRPQAFLWAEQEVLEKPLPV